MAILRPAGDFDRSYAQDMALLRRPWHYWLLGVSLLAAFTLPVWSNAYLIGAANQIAYTIIAVQGLNVLTGYTGQISLSQAAFMLVGGYASALLVIHAGLSFFIALPLAALVAGLIGLIFGLTSLRVKGFYLVFATLAAQFIIPWMSRHTFKEYLGGANGAIDVPQSHAADGDHQRRRRVRDECAGQQPRAQQGPDPSGADDGRRQCRLRRRPGLYDPARYQTGGRVTTVNRGWWRVESTHSTPLATNHWIPDAADQQH